MALIPSFGAALFTASRHEQAAGYIADLAGDETGFLRGEIKDEIRDLLRAAKPAHRRLIHPARVRVRADGPHHGRVDATRRDGVHADVVGAELAREMTREADQRRLRGRVMNAD